MRSIIPDVDKNTNITGVADESGHTLFYRNGTLIGTIEEPQFSERFFGIWLDEKSSQPKFRKKLLGERG